VARGEGVDAGSAALLVARAQLRLNEPKAALAALRKRAWSARDRLTADILSGIAEHRTGAKAAGVRRLERAHADAKDNEQRAEAAYYRGWAAYRDRELDVAEHWLQAALDDADDILAARAHMMLGYVEEAREDYTGSGRSFRSAFRMLRSTREKDAGLASAVLHALSVYGAELPDARLKDLAAREWQTLAVGAEGEVLEHVVQTVIHVGLGSENAGLPVQALETYDKAAALASGSPAAVASAELAAADLLRILNEPISARRSLMRAAEALRTAAAKEIEQQMPFLEAASVAARLEPAHANEWLARYAALAKADDGRWALARDRRVEALELHARGLVEAALGRREAGTKKISAALTLWTELGYLRRAAYASADLRAFAGKGDAAVETQFTKVAPEHPIGASQSATEATPNAWPSLSPALSAMLEALCAGRSVREIAAASGRSEFTLRNHLKRLFKAFGVKSSAALVAAALSDAPGKSRRRMIKPPTLSRG
jgi:DNA-binding CsgD family transcriptional regulator